MKRKSGSKSFNYYSPSIPRDEPWAPALHPPPFQQARTEIPLNPLNFQIQMLRKCGIQAGIQST